MATLGKSLITLVALVTSSGCFIADWNETHIYNPTWPPHAKFHNGQTMSMGALLGLATLWCLYAPVITNKAGTGAKGKENEGIWRTVRRDAELANLQTAVVLGALYWVTQASGYIYPGSYAFDPIPGHAHDERDHLAQLKLDVTLLSMLSLGWWLERKRIMAA
ncbi:Alpha beta-hydrolase [Mycena sanguinolenta]|uniref:Alpha beta-hydrolase n=1 Tax=Mycena sanguinolenta TaxID=230812 RepID=A0A8H6XGL2_9AGAR|nr:Alpha beta-hydrolase [Mycena sanguinolenta]